MTNKETAEEHFKRIEESVIECSQDYIKKDLLLEIDE